MPQTPTPASSFPLTRMRRLRQAPWVRELVRETRLHPSDFILPLFVHEKEGSEPIASLPGVSRHDVAGLVAKAKEAYALGIPAIALFPVVPAEKKDATGSESTNENNLACRAIRAVKEAVPNIGVIADVALDPYASHGHDGLLNEKGDVDNDSTVNALVAQSFALLNAGADVLAPSDMMDGRIGAIRMACEMEGYTNAIILAYAAKFASTHYGPFRDAVGSNREGYLDKSTYQMDPANAEEALREIAIDIAEGADMVMVKPGLPYLDIITRAAQSFPVPVLAYQVSAEYAMIGSQPNAEALLMEQLLCLKRGGARAILTYGAIQAIRLL